MVIFVSGGWRKEQAAFYKEKAESLGALIAKRGFDLTCGPGTGIARFVVDGYRSVEKRGKVIFYLPKRSEMERVGEDVGGGGRPCY